MTIKLFITGTHTEVGKTYASVKLLSMFNQAGLSTLGIKPLASGCSQHRDRLYNHDALLLQHHSSIKLPYECVNPFAFKPAIAPHIAAQREGTPLTLTKLNDALANTLTIPADIMLIEGVGGWHTPLNESETMADFVLHHQFQTILIVRIQLGCLNHAILTQRAIHASGIPLMGWIANCATPHIEACNEQINTLISFLSTPHLATLSFNSLATEHSNLALSQAISYF